MMTPLVRILLGLSMMAMLACDQGDATTPPLRVAADPPAASFIEVVPGIKLEVLEWSASGPPVVLLAGATDTAHIYEYFAPFLTDRFRVVGITRRNHGASTNAGQDFGIDQLVDDVIAVLDAKNIQQAHFVAASFGGAELSHIAARHPERVLKMAFLDAGWDFFEVYYAEGFFGPWPDVPLTDGDKASPQAVAANMARTFGTTYPMGEIRARHQFAADGRLIARDPNIGNMFAGGIRASLKPLTYAGMEKPTLIVRALPGKVEDMFPYYASFDQETQERARSAFDRWTRIVIPAGDRFVAHLPHAEVLRIEGGVHDVAVAYPGRILPTLREFLER